MRMLLKILFLTMLFLGHTPLWFGSALAVRTDSLDPSQGSQHEAFAIARFSSHDDLHERGETKPMDRGKSVGDSLVVASVVGGFDGDEGTTSGIKSTEPGPDPRILLLFASGLVGMAVIGGKRSVTGL